MKTGRATPNFGDNEDGVLPPPAPPIPQRRPREPSSRQLRSRERSLTPWDGAGEDTATEIDDDKLRAALANLRAGMALSSVVSKRDAEGVGTPPVERLPAIPEGVSRLLESGGILDESIVLDEFESAPNQAPAVVGPDTEPNQAPAVFTSAAQASARARPAFASQSPLLSDTGTVESASSPLDSDPFPDVPIVVHRPATSNRVMLMAGIGFLMVGLVGAVLLSPGFISRVRPTSPSVVITAPSNATEKASATPETTTIAHSVVPMPSSAIVVPDNAPAGSASAVQPEAPPNEPSVHQVLIAKAVVEEPKANEQGNARAEQNGIEPPASAPTPSLRVAAHAAKVRKAVKPKKVRIKPKARRAPSGSTSPEPDRPAVLAQPPAAAARATDPDATLPPTN